MDILTRKEKIELFIKDYYFGYNKAIALLRLIGGPALIIIGFSLIQTATEESAKTFGIFCEIYGFYMILKPFLWVLFRFKDFKSTKIAVSIEDDSLVLKSEFGESKKELKSFSKIFFKFNYYTFVVTRTQRFRIPKRFLSEADVQALNKLCS